MFFGVPHAGADIADKASKFLSILSLVFNVNKSNVKDLRPKSQRFANISSEFRSVQSKYSIPVISFYETVQYNHTLGLVSEYSLLVCDTSGSSSMVWQLPILFEMLYRLFGSCRVDSRLLASTFQSTS